jgi:hypothetical protein
MLVLIRQQTAPGRVLLWFRHLRIRSRDLMVAISFALQCGEGGIKSCRPRKKPTAAKRFAANRPSL